ncbi:alpha/beta hydrolase [Lacibacter cauensis]|uniref:alpha/beta hydrolase n=1 Tax=Lacibacter cauensis TaxID=510947 RepID=UPI001315276F|nr:alpha/beta hydrolase [Lacibacter cauensis]
MLVPKLLLYNLFFLVICSDFVKGQQTVCDQTELCLSIIGEKYSESEKKILLDNWNDFSGENLNDQFPIDKNIKTRVISLRFDGIGCIYPSFINDTAYRALFLNNQKDQRDYTKLSFFDSYYSDTVDGKFRKALPGILSENLVQTIVGKRESIERNESGAKEIYAFRKTWNSYYLPEIDRAFKAQIQSSPVKYVFFFIHGFNVPYALAHLQGNRMFKEIIENLPKSISVDEVLFVRVFWPALSEKKSDFMNNRCDITNNKLKVHKSKAYYFGTNRAYLAGNTLNNIIAKFPTEVSIQIMTHSFGSVVASSTILCPKPKISERQQAYPLNSELLKAFKESEDLSKHQLHFFMNAAGMPGVSTFSKINQQKNQNHYFYIGHNRKDKTLLKAFIPLIRFPTTKNSSSLGCNYRKEVSKVKHLFAREMLSDHFYEARTSNDKEHDFFCYVQQPQYRQFLITYLHSLK